MEYINKDRMKKSGSSKTLDSLASQPDLSGNTKRGEPDASMSLDEMMEKEFNMDSKEIKKILKSAGSGEPKRYETRRLPLKSKWIKFGVVSDTHMGHKNYRPDILDHAVKRFDKEGIEFVVMPGDVLEGMSGREGHVYELAHIGATEQINYAVSELNKIKQPIYAITATNSHDGWFSNKGNMGFEVGPVLDEKVKNFNFIGYDEADLVTSKGLIIRLTHPGDGTAYALCFDDKTEIMTEDGWKLFKDLNKDERVATLNVETDSFEWQKPTDYTDEYYSGEMLHFKSRNVDVLVTPNHRMLVRRYPVNLEQVRKKEFKFPKKSHGLIDTSWKFIEAKELRDAKRQEWQMKRNSKNWLGEIIDKIEIPTLESKNKGMIKRMKHVGSLCIEDVAELIAWYVTEGYIKKTSISICQDSKVNPINHQQIIDLFERIGLKTNTNGRNKKNIVVYSKELADWLVEQCGSGSRNKYLPKWLKNQPTDVLEIIFDTMIRGDGWISNKAYGYKSISKRLRDDFGEVCHKLGYAVTYNKDSLSISEVQTLPTINTKPEPQEYSGKIYCVSVPNTTILVRRNGKTLWTGNSYKGQKYLNSLSGGQKPHLCFQGHYHKAMYMFYRNVHMFDAGCLEEQTIFMKKKGTPAHLGYWIVEVNGDKNGVESVKPEFVPFYE
jgi:hypothetical protein